MRRIAISELLDTDAGSKEEVSGSLADLWLINRAFGGVSTTQNLIERVVNKASLSRISLLEVASGPGHVPYEVKRRLQRRGVDVEISLLDRSRSHMNGSSTGVAADAVALPFRDESFDIVSSNLFVHHLMPDGVRKFVSEALRVCRTAVIVNDVRRNALHLALVYAGLPLFRSRLTWHDAPASVRQAYRVEEMLAMVQNTPAARVEISRHYLFRMGVIAWKH